ncbi:MAG: hypothetical protein KGJ77_05790 [Acidobacteriota bacterium]|nr:hypothetical protein [Acidobacteriota bacterium]
MATLVAAATLAGCSGTGTGEGQAFSRPGPHAVGVTTLDLGTDGTLGERRVTIFYPADGASAARRPAYSYKVGDPLPQALVAIVPAKFDPTITSTARVEPAGSAAGPFPVVLFSHGFGASRLFYSHLLTGIASWGFVVVSADYLERGLLAQALHSPATDSPALDLEIMFSSLTAVEALSADPSSPLHGLADSKEVAAVGHSAGGQTAFDALADPRVRTAVGWAPVGPSAAPSRKPVVIIGARNDIALTPATLTSEYHAFRGDTTFVEVSNEGHNTFTDLCPSIRGGGGGLVGFAVSLHLISGELAQLATNGCTARNIPADRFWPIVQAYTVASLRAGLGISTQPPATAVDGSEFAGFHITVQHHR